MDRGILFNFGVAMLAVLGPLSNIPIFLSYTRNVTPTVRFSLSLLISAVTLGLLLVFLFFGQEILSAFKITIPAFRIAGGILLLLIGLRMVLGQPKIQEESSPNDGPDMVNLQLNKILVPVAVPMFVGPGSISTVILYSQKTAGWGDFLALALVLCLVALIVLLCLLSSEWIQTMLGENGIEMTTRFLGLILCAIAVQFFFDGLGQATIGIINPEFTHT